MTRILSVWCVIWVLTVGLWADDPINQEVLNDTVKKLFDTELTQGQKAFKDNPDVMVRRGIVADRKQREVRLLAVACGLAEGSPTEFLVVSPGGKDYESLTATLAKPSELVAAMKFIGLQAGRPSDRREFQFWPKGERVKISFQYEKDGKAVTVPAEELIVDTRTEKTLPAADWMFVGSTINEVDGKPLFLADNTGDVISDFNSPWTVFDVPYRAEQGAVYGSLVPNPKHLWKIREPIRIIIAPALPADQKRVVDWAVLVHGKDGQPAAQTADLRLTVTEGQGEKRLAGGEFKSFLEQLLELVKEKKDVFIKFEFADDLQVGPLVEFAALIQQLVDKDIIRIEADPTQLFYEAFLPSADWRDPKKRVLQPLELHLNFDGNKHLFRYYEEEFLNSGDVKLTEKSYQFLGSAELMKIIAGRKDWETGTILFYCPANAAHGLVRKFYLEQRKQFPVSYVFLEK